MKFQVSSLNTVWVMLRTKFKNENKQRAITPKVWCLELWLLCSVLLLNKIYLPIKFYVDALHSFQVILWTNFKNENEQRAITQKVWCIESLFLGTALLLNEIYLTIKFHVKALHSFKVMLRTKFNNENEQRAITLKVWSFELWFLCSALLLNEIYLPMKFQVSNLNTVWVMLRTKFKNENEQRAITPKVWCLELWFLCIALLWDLSTYEFLCWCFA